jgi:hypothetical protein
MTTRFYRKIDDMQQPAANPIAKEMKMQIESQK